MKPVIVSLALTLASSSLFAEPLPPEPQPSVSTVTPASGLTRGGELVHIHGTNLEQTILCFNNFGCTTTVTFGGSPATIIDATSDEVVVIAPPHAAGPVDLEVTNPAQGVATVSPGYLYREAQVDDKVRLLIPVATSIAGAQRTIWETEVLVNNSNAENVVIDGASAPQGDVLNGNSPATVPPFSTLLLSLGSAGDLTPGVFVYVPRRLADNVLISARVHETLRDGQSWGVEIPAVPEGQFRRFITLPGIPTDARFRTLLRIYDYSATGTTVSVSLRDDQTGELLDARTLSLASGLRSGTAPPLLPAFGQLSLEGIVAPLSDAHPRLRVEVGPTGSTDPPIWAFISITNNVTEQVTTRTPAIVSTAVAVPTSRSLTLGHWGSEDACLDVTATEVTTTFHCDGGSFPTPLIGLDGRFEVDGTFQSLFPLPGPVVAAHYSGVLQGNSLTIAVRAGTTTVPGINAQFGFPDQCNSSAFCPISDDPLRKGH